MEKSGVEKFGVKHSGVEMSCNHPTPKLMCMNSKLKTKDGNPMDLRLPGIAGRLKEMDARELASFTALASNNEEKSRRQATERYWYFVTKIILTYCEKKNCSSDLEKLLKFEAEGREFAKFLRSLEQFIQTVKGQNNFW